MRKAVWVGKGWGGVGGITDIKVGGRPGIAGQRSERDKPSKNPEVSK